MLTPKDIHETEFKRVWKGYSPEEVDEFLSRVVQEYEKVYKENEALRERVRLLEEQAQAHTASESQITLTLEVAKQAAADAKAAAEKEADATLRRARVEAEEIVARARRASVSQARQFVAVQEDIDRFRERAAMVLRDFLAQLDEWENPVPPVVNEVAAGSDDRVAGGAATA